MLALASCGGNKAEIPCSKVTGSQPGLVAADGNAMFALAGDSKSGSMLSLTVRLKRNKPLENLDTAKAGEIQFLSDMVVDIIGNDGTKLCSMSLFGDADKAAFKEMLASGNEAEVTFAKVMVDADKAKEVLKNAAKFTLTMPEMKYPLCLNFTGTIAGKAVQMTLCIALDHNVKGAYYYKQFGPKALLVLKGTQNEDGKIELDEYNSDGIFIATHHLTAKNLNITGEYEDNGDSYIRPDDDSIFLSPDKSMARIDMSKIDFSYFDKGYRTMLDDIDWWIYRRYGSMKEFKQINYNKIDDYIKACNALICKNQGYNRFIKTLSVADRMWYESYNINAAGRSAFLKDFLPRVDVKKLTPAQVQRLNQLKARAKSFYHW